MAKSTLFNSIKFKKLVRTLHMPAPHVLGHLQYMWMPAYDTGNPTFNSLDDIEIAADWQGEPGAFAAAVTSTDHCFVDPSQDGKFVIHDFWEHAPDYVKKREEYKKQNKRKVVKRRVSNTLRVGKFRKNSENVGNFPPTEPNRTESNPTQPNQAEADRTEPNRTEADPANFSRRSASAQLHDDIENAVSRLLSFEAERNRGPATQALWRVRVQAMARLPDGIFELHKFCDECESRRNPRNAAKKGYSKEPIRDESRWLNDQTQRWLKANGKSA